MGFLMDYLQRMAQTPYLQRIEAIWGVTPWMMFLIGVVMFVSWSAAYVLIFRKCQRDKTYGVPVASVPLNITWEFLLSFDLTGKLPPFLFPLAWGHRIWLIPDALIVYQTLKFGPAVQSTPFMRRWFRTIFVASWVVGGYGLYHFMRYFNDGYGVASSFLMNLVMSVLFIGLFFRRPDMAGLSYAAAWLKMIGTAAGGLFCYFWWPVQFVDGTVDIEWRSGVVSTPEPASFAFVNYLYLAIFAIDCFYIYLLWRRRKELREGIEPSELVEAPAHVAA